MEKAMATHSSTLAWKIPWTEEPGGLQSMGLLRVEHDWATSLYFSLSCIGEGNGNPLQYSCLEKLRNEGAWWAAVYRVTQNWTWLKWLSSSNVIHYINRMMSKNHMIVLVNAKKKNTLFSKSQPPFIIKTQQPEIEDYFPNLIKTKFKKPTGNIIFSRE